MTSAPVIAISNRFKRFSIGKVNFSRITRRSRARRKPNYRLVSTDSRIPPTSAKYSKLVTLAAPKHRVFTGLPRSRLVFFRISNRILEKSVTLWNDNQTSHDTRNVNDGLVLHRTICFRFFVPRRTRIRHTSYWTRYVREFVGSKTCLRIRARERDGRRRGRRRYGRARVNTVQRTNQLMDDDSSFRNGNGIYSRTSAQCVLGKLRVRI